MTGDLDQLRAEYLFSLAHLCHIPPPMVDDLTLSDFAACTDSINAYQAALKNPPRA